MSAAPAYATAPRRAPSRPRSPRPAPATWRALARRPSVRALWLAGALVLAALGIELASLPAIRGAAADAGLLPALRTLWWAAALLVAAALAIDRARIPRLALPWIERELPRSLALHDPAWVRLVVHGGEPGARYTLIDTFSEGLESEGLPLEIPPAREGGPPRRLRYRVRPLRRGDVHFGAALLRGDSPLGLWKFTAEAGLASNVRVYPNFAAVARYDALETEHHAAHVGIVRRQRRGEGLEFHQLRDYRPGDPPRQIDWKATSRKQTLIAREYEDERDQRVVFLLDCSRRMRAVDEDLSHFDHALNAMILLAHVALRAGDSVGLLTLGEPSRWLAPRKGVGAVQHLLNAVYDLEPTTLGADFGGAAENLCRRLPRRALVILLTTLRSEDIDDLLPGLALLQRRHLPLVVNLRSRSLDAARTHRVASFRQALRFLGASEHLRERRATADALRARGAVLLDTSARGLTPRLVNHYFDVKRSGAL